MGSEWDFIRDDGIRLDDALSHLESQQESLAEWCSAKMHEKGLAKNVVVRESRLNQTFAYQILAGTRHPSRDKLIQLSFGMQLDADEACELLERGGVNRLKPNIIRDVIIAFCLERGETLSGCDDRLWERSIPTVSPDRAVTG